eukprot:6195919-Pleurochrysis_carterae.AAC.1
MASSQHGLCKYASGPWPFVARLAILSYYDYDHVVVNSTLQAGWAVPKVLHIPYINMTPHLFARSFWKNESTVTVKDIICETCGEGQYVGDTSTVHRYGRLEKYGGSGVHSFLDCLYPAYRANLTIVLCSLCSYPTRTCLDTSQCFITNIFSRRH